MLNSQCNRITLIWKDELRAEERRFWPEPLWSLGMSKIPSAQPFAQDGISLFEHLADLLQTSICGRCMGTFLFDK